MILENNSLAIEKNSVLTVFQEKILSFFFVLFLYFCFVGLLPFGPRQPYILEQTGAGDLLQQFFYVLIILIFGFITLVRSNFSFLKVMGISVIIPLVWIFLSTFWSDAPAIAFRRASFTLVVALTVFLAISLLSPLKIFKILYYTLLAHIVASLLAGLFVHNAIHREGMRGSEELIGLWRGVFYHKNGAGAAAAFLFILSFQQIIFGSIVKNKFLLWIGLLSSIPLMYLAFSKTSLLLVLPSIAIASAMTLFISGREIYSRFLLLILMSVGLLIASIAFYQFDILSILEDPDALTGRSTIWKSVMIMIEARPWLGFGYGSAFEVGVDTPFMQYAIGWDARIELVHAHNGYLQVAVEQGIIGLLFAVIAFLILPLFKIIFSTNIPREFIAPLLAIMTFFVLHNIFEVSLMYRGVFIWVIFLIAIATVNYYTKVIKN